jgi:hypothetical protein
MSSYDPIEDEDDRAASTDPGVKEKEIADQRDFADVVSDFDRVDYLVLGVLIGVPAGLLTIVLILHFFPDFQNTAGAFVRWLVDFVTTVAPSGGYSSATLGCIVGSPAHGSAKYSRISSSDSSSR